MRTKTGLAIIQVALILGVLGDVLLRQTPWGLNVLLFNLAFAGGTVTLLRLYAPERLTKQTYALLGALVFFASMFVWRDAIELRVADTFAIIVILGVVFLPTLKITASIAGAFQYAISVVWAGVNSLFAPFVLLASDIGWTELPMSGWRKHAFAVLRSLLIVTPLILIFGALFMAADAVYDGWVRRMLNVDFETIFSHGIIFTVFAWLTAGYFRGVIFGGTASVVESSLSIIAPDAEESEGSPVARMRAETGEPPVTLPDNKTVVEHINISDPSDPKKAEGESEKASTASSATGSAKRKWSWADLDNSIVPGFTLGTVEIAVILGLINLLFLSFVIFQLPYLFGGMDLVQNTPDFKLAAYARRGFGELVTVAGLVLPILLASHWLIRRDSPNAQKLFRVLAGVQIGLLFIIMASAVQRLVLLTGNLGYGMTTVRFYPMVFMLWLAVVFVWFGATVLRGARKHFAWGALWSAFVILGATHVLNPDAFIVKTNIALLQQGRAFDGYYNFSLSADAVPEALAALPQLSLEQQCSAKVWLHIAYRQLGETGDLRSLNVSRKIAWYALNQNDAVIHKVEGCSNWVRENLKLDEPER